VILSSGSGGYSTEWSLVQPALAHTGRVCAYDRAGLGWSDSGPGNYSPGAAADELERLLEAAAERGPYVLVGQSLGARAVQLFALRHPELVAGLVLVDPRSVHIDDRQTQAMVAAERQEVAAFQEQLAMLAPVATQ
jgi:pimeloyl-ACP methyl ester carboxylesterase